MSLNEFEKCMSKEEILALVFANNEYERAARRFLQLGLADEAERFFILSVETKNTEIMSKNTSDFGQYTNKIHLAAAMNMEVVEALGRKIPLVGEIGKDFGDSSNRILNATRMLSDSAQTISSAVNRMNNRY